MTLLVLLVVSLLGSVLLVTTTTDLAISDNYRSGTAAFYHADSGLEQTIVDLDSDDAWIVEILDTGTSPPSLAEPFPASLTINGNAISLDTEDGQVVQGYYAYGDAVPLGDGSYEREIFLPPDEVTPANASGRDLWIEFPLRAEGTAGLAAVGRRTLSATLRTRISRLSAWDNAIFADAGSSGTGITGNVEVRGSVHVLGREGTTVLRWTGTATVLNHYDGIDGNLGLGSYAAKLPELPTWEYNGETVSTLDAVVRVKSGDVQITGSASLGEADAPGNGLKETLDGLYLDGDLDVTGSAAVHADALDGYDVEGMEWPSLDDPYTAPGGATYATHRDYLNTQGLSVPVTRIAEDAASFSYADAKGNRIAWDADDRILEIAGIVRIDGDLVLGGGSGADAAQGIAYAGAGTLYATRDVYIEGDVVPVGDYLDIDDNTVHNLGIVADGSVRLASLGRGGGPDDDSGSGDQGSDADSGNSQWENDNDGGTAAIEVMAAIYAEETFVDQAQSRVAGAVVAGSLEFGNLVPRVYQVPRLGTNLPPGLPGTPVLVVSEIEMRDWFGER